MNETELLIAELEELIKDEREHSDEDYALVEEYNSQGKRDKAVMYIMIGEAHRMCAVKLEHILWRYKIKKEQNEK